MRHTTFATAAIAFVLFLSACSSTKGVPPIRSEFMDIPLPGGLTYMPGESAVIESETVRAARLTRTRTTAAGS